MATEPSDFRTRWTEIEHLRHGDHHADWDWFLRRYHTFAVAVLRQLLPEADVDAAAEEFWGYLFQSRALERADPGGRFRSFLAGILTRYAMAWRRQNRPKDAAVDPDLFGRDAQLPEAHEVALWAQQILHLGLERLGRSYPNEELALRWFYGLPTTSGGDAHRVSATVISARLGCSANAVHQALFRGRARLRDCITAEIAATIGSMRDLHDELTLLRTALERATPGLIESPEQGDRS